MKRSEGTKKAIHSNLETIKAGTHGATNRCNTSQQHVAATRRSNKFHRVNRRILSKILSPQQNFVAATCRTKSNWFNFVRHFAATKFCRGDKILIDLPPNVEEFTRGDLSLQPIAAMSAYDLSLDCTHKAMCCSNVLQRFVASCVPTLIKKGTLR